jgi:hypothetical protein
MFRPYMPSLPTTTHEFARAARNQRWEGPPLRRRTETPCPMTDIAAPLPALKRRIKSVAPESE